MLGMKTIVALLLAVPLPVVAQDHLVRIQYDNDFFSATDQYYTQGVRMEYIAPVFERSPVRHVLLRPQNATASYAGIAIQRDGFTPSGIRINHIPHGDRPYAATMFISQFALVLNRENHTRIFSQLDLGMIGPIVGGREEQTGIHKAIGDILPLGWEYQVANDAVVNYTVEVEKGLLRRKLMLLTGFTQGRLGTLYTDVSAGALVRIGWMNDYFSNVGISTQGGLRKFQGYVFAKGSVKAVGYNATMQGGLSGKSIYTLPASSVERVVTQGSCGVVVSYKRMLLEYTKVYLSPEYTNGLSHGWGHCSLSFCF
jgi:lipid A 3-O-deacylase